MDFRSSLCTQCVDFRDIPLSIDPEICVLPRDLPGYGHPSNSVTDPGCIPHGTGNYYKYDLLCLCPILGAMGELSCLGLVDSERCLFHRNVFCTIVYHVRSGIGIIAGVTHANTNRTTSEGEVLLSSASATWLLPIVSCVVTSASGSVVAEVLPNPQYALGTIIASYVVWGIGVPMALMMTVIYLLRLMLYKLPPKAAIASTFLPIGPLGQGGYGLVHPLI